MQLQYKKNTIKQRRQRKTFFKHKGNRIVGSGKLRITLHNRLVFVLIQVHPITVRMSRPTMGDPSKILSN